MHTLKMLSNKTLKDIIKLHQKKYRDEKGLFIAEGIKAFEEIKNSQVEIVTTYTTNPKYKDIAEVIAENKMKKISTTASTCEFITIAKKKYYSNEEISNLNKIILLDSVSDPGNLGTIIRSAAAFDIDAIILFGNCVELYSPKVIRSSAGNFFKIPIISYNNIKDIDKYFPNHIKISTALRKENNISIKEVSKLEKYIIMFGSEANGLNKILLQNANKNIILEMKKNVESLNLSISASIILYELFKNN